VELVKLVPAKKNPVSDLRSRAIEQYASARQSLAGLEKYIAVGNRDNDALVRAGFESFLGSLDCAVGWLLADDEISHRGQALLRRTRHTASSAAGQERTTAEDDATERPAPHLLEPAKASSAEVTFTLPAEVHADSVALCGEFNQWSPDSIQLERGRDGIWRTTVTLEPGRSYRYRYLLDGKRWENGWHADRYVPNPYGSTDSVITVEPHLEVADGGCLLAGRGSGARPEDVGSAITDAVSADDQVAAVQSHGLAEAAIYDLLARRQHLLQRPSSEAAGAEDVHRTPDLVLLIGSDQDLRAQRRH
jgi:hypothetical protein